ncbi:hypothetical protein, partial [Myceligenerans cantabricum]
SQTTDAHIRTNRNPGGPLRATRQTYQILVGLSKSAPASSAEGIRTEFHDFWHPISGSTGMTTPEISEGDWLPSEPAGVTTFVTLSVSPERQLP